MELKTVFTNVEPANRNVIWLSIVNGVLLQKVYTAKGWVNLYESQPQAVGELNFQFIQDIPDIVINI